MSNIVNRVTGKTPKFFKLLRTLGVALAAASGALLAAPIELPEAVNTLAGYVAVAGSVMGAVSQTAVLNEEE
ncbi:hypothetical protein [Paraflavitalea pollutisoli]|uniref:hypothetical protein n=1 Tax=Paraflavitalea pollutisoli TaxID=3034143 RepID=UPI0023ECF255|nr:hypothetical protein [Paraflavitalea sp. H1-2-19X]